MEWHYGYQFTYEVSPLITRACVCVRHAWVLGPIASSCKCIMGYYTVESFPLISYTWACLNYPYDMTSFCINFYL